MNYVLGCVDKLGLAQMDSGSVSSDMVGHTIDNLHRGLDLSHPVVLSESFLSLTFSNSLSRLVRLAWLISFMLIGFGLSCHSEAASDPGRRIEPVYGAGPSTRIVSLFFDQFSKHPEAAGIEFSVPERSTKHAGGIRASDRYLFGRTGRPLTTQEKAQNKLEIILGRVPVGFATGPTINLPALTFADIDSIFSGVVEKWSDLGGPDAAIVLVGREATEAVLMALSRQFPSLIDANYQKILKRDHAVVNYLNSPAGKFGMGYGAISNFSSLNIIELQGPSLGINVGLVVDEKNLDNPVVQAVKRYADSEEWRQHIENAGYYSTMSTDRNP